MQLRPKYLDYISVAVEIGTMLPPYSSKFSKRTFTQQQLMTLYVLKQKSKMSYTEFIEDFRVRDSAMLELGLTKLPKESTLRMFAKRTKIQVFEKLLGSCVGRTRNRKLNTAIDATGFELEDGSFHYLQRLGRSNKERKSLKLSACVDTDNHLFLSAKTRKDRRHDVIDFEPVLRRARKYTAKKIKVVTADKGYDSEKLHELSHLWGITLIAPLRNKAATVWRTKGVHRKKLRRNFPKKMYNRRSIIESMFFRVKRLCGKAIFAKNWVMQRKEMLGRLLAYNIHRLVQIMRICG